MIFNNSSQSLELSKILFNYTRVSICLIIMIKQALFQLINEWTITQPEKTE